MTGTRSDATRPSRPPSDTESHPRPAPRSRSPPGPEPRSLTELPGPGLPAAGSPEPAAAAQAAQGPTGGRRAALPLEVARVGEEIAEPGQLPAALQQLRVQLQRRQQELVPQQLRRYRVHRHPRQLPCSRGGIARRRRSQTRQLLGAPRRRLRLLLRVRRPTRLGAAAAAAAAAGPGLLGLILLRVAEEGVYTAAPAGRRRRHLTARRGATAAGALPQQSLRGDDGPDTAPGRAGARAAARPLRWC